MKSLTFFSLLLFAKLGFSQISANTLGLIKDGNVSLELCSEIVRLSKCKSASFDGNHLSFNRDGLLSSMKKTYSDGTIESIENIYNQKKELTWKITIKRDSTIIIENWMNDTTGFDFNVIATEYVCQKYASFSLNIRYKNETFFQGDYTDHALCHYTLQSCDSCCNCLEISANLYENGEVVTDTAFYSYITYFFALDNRILTKVYDATEVYYTVLSCKKNGIVERTYFENNQLDYTESFQYTEDGRLLSTSFTIMENSYPFYDIKQPTTYNCWYLYNSNLQCDSVLVTHSEFSTPNVLSITYLENGLIEKIVDSTGVSEPEYHFFEK